MNVLLGHYFVIKVVLQVELYGWIWNSLQSDSAGRAISILHKPARL